MAARGAGAGRHKPWMLYYSTGCSHARTMSSEWADKIQEQVRPGLGQAARRDLRAPEEAGIIPQDAEIPRGPTSSRPGTRSATVKKESCTRQMEVFAGFSENADWNVGRLLGLHRRLGDLDNTLIIYIWGDNGASMEDTTTGSFNEMTFLNGIVLDADQQLALIEQYGGIRRWAAKHRRRTSRQPGAAR